MPRAPREHRWDRRNKNIEAAKGSFKSYDFKKPKTGIYGTPTGEPYPHAVYIKGNKIYDVNHARDYTENLYFDRMGKKHGYVFPLMNRDAALHHTIAPHENVELKHGCCALLSTAVDKLQKSKKFTEPQKEQILLTKTGDEIIELMDTKII